MAQTCCCTDLDTLEVFARVLRRERGQPDDEDGLSDSVESIDNIRAIGVETQTGTANDGRVWGLEAHILASLIQREGRGR